jgi:hypothetical protein
MFISVVPACDSQTQASEDEAGRAKKLCHLERDIPGCS